MSEDVTAVEVQQETAQPSLADAYESQHGDPTGAGAKRKPAESGRNTTLTDEEGSAREIGESERQRHIAKIQPEKSLADAYDGIAAPDAEEFELPDAFTAYSAEDIEAVLGLMGLSEDDLKDPRFAALVLKELESSFSPVDSEDEADEETEDAEEEEAEEKAEEKQPEEKKPEEKPATNPLAKKLADLTPEERTAMQAHIEQVFDRSKQINAPVYTEHFVSALGKALDCPPEQMERLGGVVEILQFGAQNLVESAVPALVHRYMQENFAPNFGAIMESYAPGLADSYREAVVANTWADTLEMDEFKDAGLPKFGTPEFDEAAKTVHEKNPWLNDFDPKDKNGRPLPILEALHVKAAVTARLLAGEKLSPKQVMAQIAEAQAAVRKNAEGHTRRVTASRILSSGRHTSGSMEKPKSERESLMDAYARGSGGGAI